MSRTSLPLSHGSVGGLCALVVVLCLALSSTAGAGASASPPVPGPRAPAPEARSPSAASTVTVAGAGVPRVTDFGYGILEPKGIATGSDGNLWFVSSGNATIGRSTPGGELTMFPLEGLASPSGITSGPDGNLWFTAVGAIGRMTPIGTVTKFTGPAIITPAAIAAGPDGALWFTDTASKSIVRMTVSGDVQTFSDPAMLAPGAIVSGPGGLWYTDATATTKQIGRITTNGVVSTYALPGSGAVPSLAAGPDGNVWYTDPAAKKIGRLTPAGVVTEFTDLWLGNPGMITAGADGALWFANDSGYYGLGRITTGGSISTINNPPSVSSPYAKIGALTVGPDGNVWFTNADNSIGKVTSAGKVSRYRGTWVDHPSEITAGPDGALWFANEQSASIGRITTAGDLSHFTGLPVVEPETVTVGVDGNLWFSNRVQPFAVSGYLTPQGAATSFAPPQVIVHHFAAGPDGNMWFTNSLYGERTAVGRVTPTGTVTLFTDSLLAEPDAITAGGDGNLWFTAWDAIGRITPSGVMTLFSNPTIGLPGDIVAGPDGNVWFTNRDKDAIGRVTPDGSYTAFPAGVDAPGALVVGPDARLWYTSSTGTLGVMSTTGVATTFSDATLRHPHSLAAGPDNAIWYTDLSTNSIGRIALPPKAPTALVATAAKQSVSVAWTAPSTVASEAITGYTVAASPGGATCATAGALSCVVTGLTAGTSYTFTVTATNPIGTSAPSTATDPVTPWDGSGFHPVPPSRLLDSRTALGSWAGALRAGSPQSLLVTGAGGASDVPATAAAVVLNVTATAATEGSFLTAWPAGAAPPGSSNLNFAAGETIPNLVTVRVGHGGRVSFANAKGSVHVVADVVGYYDDGTGAGDLFTGITPTRVLDSRTPTGGWSAPLTAGAPRDLLVRGPAGGGGVPESATAVVANVTVTGGTEASFASVWPSGVAQPGVSNLNFAAGQTIPNLAIVKIGENGSIRLANAVGSVHVIVDVVGYFDPTGGARFHALDPKRVLDDRVGTGLWDSWGPGETRVLPVAGAPGSVVPAGATGLVANLTATGATAGTFVTVFPHGVARPGSSNLNVGRGQTIPNLVTVRVGDLGSIDLFNAAGAVDLVADVVGYYAAT